MGTATSTASRTWLTLDDGELTEVYAPASTRASATAVRVAHVPFLA